MGFNTNLLLSCVLIMLVVPLMVNSYVFDIGDAAGWSAQSQLIYNKYYGGTSFLVGDGIRFVYDPNTTNVLEVIFPDYFSCNPTSPLATYNTGNDTIPLREIGDRYFISGNLVDCNNGLMLHIYVGNNSVVRSVRGCPGCDDPYTAPTQPCCRCPGCDDPLIPRLQCCDKNTSTTTTPTTPTGEAATPTTSPTSTPAGGPAASTPTMSPTSTPAGGAAASTPTMSPNSTTAGGEDKTRVMPPNSTTSAASKLSWKSLLVVAAGLVVRFIY